MGIGVKGFSTLWGKRFSNRWNLSFYMLMRAFSAGKKGHMVFMPQPKYALAQQVDFITCTVE